MKNLKNLNTTTMIALSLLLSTGVSSLNIDNFGQIVNVSYASSNTLKVKINTKSSNLNVRKEPNANSAILTSIPKGKVVTVEATNGAWYKVTYNSKTGWILREYTTPESGTSSNTIGTAAAANTKGKVVTKGGNLTMRKDTSTASEKVGSIPNGTSVDILRYTDSWYQVKYNGTIGWCSKTYIPEIFNSTDSSKTGTSIADTSNFDGSKPAPSDTGTPVTGTKNYKTFKNVNVRIGPSTKYNSPTTYKAGTPVEVERRYVNTSENRTWFKIKGKNLWVASEFLDADTQTDSSKVTNRKKINKQIIPKVPIEKGSKDINNLAGSMVTFKASKPNVYSAVEEATVNNVKYYKVNALKTKDLSVWISASSFNDVTKTVTFSVGNKHAIKKTSNLYHKSDLSTLVSSRAKARAGYTAKIMHISSNGSSVNIIEQGNKKQGWVNKGILNTHAVEYSVHNDDLKDINIKDMFSEVYALDKEDQALNAQDAANNEEYTKITGMPCKPYLVQLDISPDQSEPFYVEQYYVDITAKDNTVTTLRFDPSDFNLIKLLYSGQEVTLYADPSTTEDPESLPMCVVGSDFIDLNSEIASYSHIEPLSDADIVAIMAEDFSNFLNSYGVTVEKFSQEDIDAIVKEINNPKVDKNSATIGGESEDANNVDSVKNDNKSNNSSSSFGGMKSKFNF